MKAAACVLFAAFACAMLAAAPNREDALPSLPDKEGFAGMFAGVSDGKLLAAGGANFPDKKPWVGGTKVWYDTIFVLDRPDGKWQPAGKLPRKLGYGVSVQLEAGVLCAGGADAEKHHRDCFLLEWTDGKPATRKLPSLPRACAYAAGARVGDAVFIAGGIETPSSTTALKTFWMLDLTKLDAGWKELEAWPGSGRILPVAATHAGAFYLFSGAELSADKDGKPVRKYLRDAYAYTPGVGWKKLAELSRATVAAPSPAPVL